MMREEYTPAVERALHDCHRIARARRSPEVGLIDLLHALLLEEEGKPFLLLLEHGADSEQLRDWVISPDESIEQDRPPLSIGESAQEAILAARRTAREVSVDPQMNSEHLLSALLAAGGDLVETLAAFGTDCRELISNLRGQIQGPTFALDEPLDLNDMTERFDIRRILDANANRAVEAMRVIEDYCRYVLDDTFLSSEFKTNRHKLASMIQTIAEVHQLDSRDTVGDVGTGLSTASEQARYSLVDVVQANFKRLQEALRSLEEYTKIECREIAITLEQMRYWSYTMEKAIISSGEALDRLADVRLCLLVSSDLCLGSLESTVKEAIAGGVQMIQLREKNAPDREHWRIAKKVRRWTMEASVLFVVNDRPDIARLVEADGVHLGQDDLSVKEARRIMPPGALIGVSTHDMEQVYQAIRDGSSYIGIGPTYPSKTKTFDELAGLDFLREVNQTTSIPAFAIGGINLANIPEAIKAGAKRVAVSNAICMSETPQASARAMRQLLDAT